MRRIPLVRLDALAGYARQPLAQYQAEEVSWFELLPTAILGAVIRDRSDDDFGGLVFARDARLRYRCVNVTKFETTARKAEVVLRRAMEEAALAAPENHYQGDEKGDPVDFFAFTRSLEQLNPDFLQLARLEAYSPAREIIEVMMRWYDDTDGNFIEQFQTTGFDQRIWELYLFAVFTEMGYQLDRREVIPDFICSGLNEVIAVEAVTVGPTRRGREIVDPPRCTSPEEIQIYLRHYMPIKFGSALFSKLKKEYWKRPHVTGKPLVFAIEDFSSPASLVHSRSALECYVYGYQHDWSFDSNDILVITPKKLKTHTWGGKEINSGFFDLPGAENISAILFSNSGTIAKFNRMGILSDFGSKRVLLVREGTSVNSDPNAVEPRKFRHIVSAPNYSETWTEGLDVFHNPKAINPLNPELMLGAAHHFLQANGTVVSYTPDWHPIASTTAHFAPVDVESAVKRLTVKCANESLSIMEGLDRSGRGRSPTSTVRET